MVLLSTLLVQVNTEHFIVQVNIKNFTRFGTRTGLFLAVKRVSSSLLGVDRWEWAASKERDRPLLDEEVESSPTHPTHQDQKDCQDSNPSLSFRQLNGPAS